MLRINARTWLYGILIGLALVLLLSLNASSAAPQQGNDIAPASLGAFIVTDALPGAVYVEGGLTSSPAHQIVGARMPTSGPLTYPELKSIEAHARQLLTWNKQFREDVSPYHGKDSFDDLVRSFDTSGGFDAPYPDPNYQVQTLGQRIDYADADLRLARDLYAYLAVYADEARFRNAFADCLDPPPEEDPFADPPVIDRCNFAARLRESLREAAYLRMIFGQQFTADALGFQFGANIVGGEAFVRQEVEKLRMAAEQYRLAREAVTEGLDHYLGSGCYVSDFYTAAEWDLLSRAVEGLERARHHTAVRTGYLAPDADGLPRAKAEADATYRAAAMDQYIDMAVTANLASGQSTCARGTGPEALIVDKMVADLLSTRQNARDMQEDRNIFGFDVRFTPARPYLTASGSTDTGLWDQAWDHAVLAKNIQDDVTKNQRNFEQDAGTLQTAIQGVWDRYDSRLNALTGCSTTDLSDSEFFTCVDDAADDLRGCVITQTSQLFQDCVRATGVGGLLKEAWTEVGATSHEIQLTQLELDNLQERINIEITRTATISHEILTSGRERSAREFGITLIESLRVSVGMVGSNPSFNVSYNPLSPLMAMLRSSNMEREALERANIDHANSKAVVHNLLLDILEKQVALEIAAYKGNAQIAMFERLAAETEERAVAARRARAYALTSPANDPSYRLVRDSDRLQLADELEQAARISYMAAKRAEYEYAETLGAYAFRLSDIYRARTAMDIMNFLNELKLLTNTWVVQDQDIDRRELTLSVAQHILGWTDEHLGLTGEDARAERLRRFREWVADNTITIDGKPALVFHFTTSLASNGGVFSIVIAQAYDRYWLHKAAGIGQPKPENIGFGMDLVTAQTDDLRYREVEVKQAGVVHLRDKFGCIFEYKLIHPAALLGFQWPQGLGWDPEVASAAFAASVNGAAYGTRVRTFLGRPVSATEWTVVIYAGSPDGILPAMDLQQLEDIRLFIDTTYATRDCTPGQPCPVPDAADCLRIDY